MRLDRRAVLRRASYRSTSERPAADSRSRYSTACAQVRSTEAGHTCRDRALERGGRTGAALRASGTLAKTCAGAQQRGDGDGDRVRRHLVDRREMALVHLLSPACDVELDHLHIDRVVEIGHRRVVEREVAVLADAQAAQVERMPLAAGPRTVALGLRSPVPCT